MEKKKRTSKMKKKKKGKARKRTSAADSQRTEESGEPWSTHDWSWRSAAEKKVFFYLDVEGGAPTQTRA